MAATSEMQLHLAEYVQQLRQRAQFPQTDALHCLDLLAQAQRIEDDARRSHLALELERSRTTEEFAAELLQRKKSAEALQRKEKAEQAKAAREAREERRLAKMRAEAAQQAAAAAHLKKLGQRKCMADLRTRQREQVSDAEFKAQAAADRKRQRDAKKARDTEAAASLWGTGMQ